MARLTGQDLKLAAQSRVLRNEEFIQMKKDRMVIHTGRLTSHLLTDVLLAGLMENKEIVQQRELPAAAWYRRDGRTSFKGVRPTVARRLYKGNIF